MCFNAKKDTGKECVTCQQRIKRILCELCSLMEEAIAVGIPFVAEFFYGIFVDVVSKLYQMYSKTKGYFTSSLGSLIRFVVRIAETELHYRRSARKFLEPNYSDDSSTARIQSSTSAMEIISILMKELEVKNMEDVCGTIGHCVAAKLRQLNKERRIIAEEMIHKVFKDLELCNLVQYL